MKQNEIEDVKFSNRVSRKILESRAALEKEGLI